MTRHLIWDWNGTLLDDVDACVDTLNTLLEERRLGRVDRESYRDSFGFPVRRFYEGLGFDFAREDFDQLSHDFIARYRQRLGGVRLHDDALSVMAALAPALERQMVISAMEQTLLTSMLRDYGVAPHLAASHGIARLDASSKVTVGVNAVRALGRPPEEFLLVGDTLHDHELAEAIGCRCVLFARGHQNQARLRTAGCPVIEDLRALEDFL